MWPRTPSAAARITPAAVYRPGSGQVAVVDLGSSNSIVVAATESLSVASANSTKVFFAMAFAMSKSCTPSGVARPDASSGGMAGSPCSAV